MHPVYYIMGVSGSGKTTIGRMLAAQLQLPFLDADDFHTAANKSKMAAGIPLTEDDRKDWLAAIHAKAMEAAAQSGVVIACSALRQSYRSLLQQGMAAVQWIYLEGSYDTIYERMQQRSEHFMPPALLASQFEILEVPQMAITIDIGQPPSAIIAQLVQCLQPLSALGIIGLGVMGSSLARNAASQGIRLSVYNRHVPGKEEKVAEQMLAAYTEMAAARAFDELPAFVQSLEKPRKILLMVHAGDATDAVLEELLPLLSAGDIVMDGGNAHYKDTERRQQRLQQSDLHWMGCGISGGEEGALHGPAVMAGGDAAAYQLVRPLLETLAAKDYRGNACCTWAGPGGAGHFVKMVHNGIEYAEMQLLAEVYHLLRNGMQLLPDAVAAVLELWNTTASESYLLGITVQILRKKEDGTFLIDQIDDRAAAKGTGSWAVQTAAALGAPATMLAQALFARFISARQQERKAAAGSYTSGTGQPLQLPFDILHRAYMLARVINHQQGFDLIKTASEQYGWHIDLAALAASWTNGCIIRSRLMEEAAVPGSDAGSLLWHNNATRLNTGAVNALRQTCTAAINAGLATPAFSDALQYLYGITTAHSPMNLVQAQRDYFGAHTYLRKDDSTGKPVHTRWQE